MVKQLKRINNTQLSYRLEQYNQEDSLAYLTVIIQGEGLCAKGIVTIRKWDDKLEGIRASKGKGYHGAELTHLKFTVYQDSLKTEFIYQSLDGIVD